VTVLAVGEAAFGRGSEQNVAKNEINMEWIRLHVNNTAEPHTFTGCRHVMDAA